MRRHPSWSLRAAAILLAAPLGLLANTAVARSGGNEDLDRAAAVLHRRAEAARQGTSEARQLSREFSKLGQACLERGESGRAVELLEEAYAWDADNGLALAELTLAYVRLENFVAARFYLSLAQDRTPAAPSVIYRTLGEAYEGLHRLEDAVDSWEEFFRLGGDDPVVLRRLAKVRAEMSLTPGQRVLDRDNFTFFYDAEIPQETVEQAAARLESAYRTQSEFLRTKLPGPQPVILYAGRAYFALSSVPDWASGVFDGKIRVSVEPEQVVRSEFSSVLAHELAHALMRRASRDRAPGWLHEGVAQWLEGRRIPRSEFRRLFAGGGRVEPLAELEARFHRASDALSARAHYAQSLGLVEFVIQERGEGALACLIEDLAAGATLEKGLREETQLSGVELVTRFKSWAGI
jgi:tetratricopeptide (TPR) repeat protein